MKLIYAAIASSIFLPVFFLLGLPGGRAAKSDSSMDNGQPSQTSVIVELFTSEGCSSCPPADALLKSLSEKQPVGGTEIIAFEEHVDYWNHLGWKDPFSSAEFSERQDRYARTFGNNGVYTPQMIVDGSTEFVGSRSREAQNVIEKAASQPKAGVRLTPRKSSPNGSVSFDIRVFGLSNIPSVHEAELWIAITEKGLHVDVKAGENSGQHLQHAPVLRKIYKSNSLTGPGDYQTHVNTTVDSAWQRENLSFVAFVVEKSSRKIIGAASAKVYR